VTTTPTTDLRQRYTEAVQSVLREWTRAPGDEGQFVARLVHAAMAVRDEELERLRYELEQWHAAYGEKALPATIARLRTAEDKIRDYENVVSRARNLCARSPLCIPRESTTERSNP
jgi:hypothetical protein